MRERINRLAKGILDLDSSRLQITPDQIEEHVNAEEITKKELLVTDLNGLHVKGLVYSSNIRVRVRTAAFGGSRNHISYEVDAACLTQGDEIAGAFFLVTGAGEYKIPYRFLVDLGISGKTLGGLLTAEDFGRLARRDSDMALRLFEYQDFIEAPFMQDMHIRTLYDGLRGHASHQNLLEEFLVALRLKEPVSLSVDTETRRYETPDGPVEAVLEVTASGWGYVQLEVKADGEFLEVPRRLYTSADFEGRTLKIPYRILPGRLHGGRNLGAILLSGIRFAGRVPIEVQGAAETMPPGHGKRRALAEYLSLRLEYEIGMNDQQQLRNHMSQELERLRKTYGESLLGQLLTAELYLMEGQTERAAAILDSCRGPAGAERALNREIYCFFQYLQYQTWHNEDQKEGLLRLIDRYLDEEEGHEGLFLLKLRLEPERSEHPAELLGTFRQLYAGGFHSPFLYVELFRMYEAQPEILRTLGVLEQQVLLFAARRGLVGEELALRAASLTGTVRHYSRIGHRLLALLYAQYPNRELLGAVCTMLIRGDCRDPEYFPWYQQALEAGISLTRLYEYFLYTLPKDYPYLLPREVLLYFSYDKDLDEDSRSRLYMNILNYMNPGAALYQQYEREMERFAMDQLLKSRINRRLAVLYQHMIYREMIDEKVARVLPAILRSSRIRVENPHMKYVIVCYEELKGEDAFPIRDGVAYVPLFSEHPVLLFQDGYGNRFANVSYRKLPAMEKDDIGELEEQCFDRYPSHPMLRLQECAEIVEAGISGEADVMTLQKASADLPLHPLYLRKIMSCVIRYYQDRLEEDEGFDTEADYLMDLDLDALSRAERASVCETLIHRDYVREAYDLVRQYGAEGIRSAYLMKLCSRMILFRMFDADELLLNLSAMVFSQGKHDEVILDYLCSHFNGSTKLMYQILSQAVREKIGLYDMPERLLAQMIFTGETAWMDQVFDWYATGQNTSENIVKAYFTLKSADYFLKDRPTGDRVFAWLEGALHSAGERLRVPTIYLLALTRYYSELPSLDAERKALCTSMTELLLSEGKVFSYFKKLGRLIPMPDSVMDKVMVEYKTDREARPELLVRVLPQEEEYHSEALKKVYPGIFVRQKVLFEGEIMEYQIYETTDGVRELKLESSISREPEESDRTNSRFAALNEMGLCLELKEEGALKEKMKKYLTDSAAMEELFLLM